MWRIADPSQEQGDARLQNENQIPDLKKIEKIQKKEIASKTKVWFLKACEVKKVVPATVFQPGRDPHAHQVDYQTEDEVGWRKAQERAGLEVLREASRREKVRLGVLELQLARGKLEAQESLGLEAWEKLRRRLGRGLIRGHNNGHRQKLRMMLARAGKPVPAWLDRSAGSVLATSSTMLGDTGPVTSTPALSRKRQRTGQVGLELLLEGEVREKEEARRWPATGWTAGSRLGG